MKTYGPVEFSCPFGGVVLNGLDSTSTNGTTITCRRTGFKDDRDREVFETPDGRNFVWSYFLLGERKDAGEIVEPWFDEEEEG